MRANGTLFLVLILLQVLLINTAWAEDAPFGRLFTSPEQRNKLDSLREKIAQDANFVNQQIAKTESLSSATTAPVKDDIEMSGYILREDGSAMIWINGRSALSGLNSNEVKITAPRVNQSQVTVHAHGKVHSLKPGQVWSLKHDHVQESYLAEPTAIPTRSEAKESTTEDDVLEVSE